jgi:diadenosine tetraphosphatase ApaH/serine/threonine PP2A family protein phosphatase
MLFEQYAAATLALIGLRRLDWLRSLPAEHREGSLLVLHACPGDLWRAPTPDAEDQELIGHYGALDADLVVYGHIHRPYVRRLPDVTVANSGSVGSPFDGDPRASYLLIEEGSTEIVRVEYDVERELALLLRSGYPDTQRIAETRQLGRFVDREPGARSSRSWPQGLRIPLRDAQLGSVQTKRWSEPGADGAGVPRDQQSRCVPEADHSPARRQNRNCGRTLGAVAKLPMQTCVLVELESDGLGLRYARHASVTLGSDAQPTLRPISLPARDDDGIDHRPKGGHHGIHSACGLRRSPSIAGHTAWLPPRPPTPQQGAALPA